MEEDPTFQVRQDERLGQTVLAGMGELHLEVVVDRLRREFGVGTQVGRPQVAYYETITRPARAEGRLVKQTGGHGQFAVVEIEVEPLPSGTGFVFENKVVGGAVPRQFIPAVEAGLRDAMTRGRAGRAADGGHQGHAGGWQVPRGGLVGHGLSHGGVDGPARGGVARPAPILLEPIMRVEVVRPTTIRATSSAT